MEEYKVARAETGIQGLDEMLGGGIPEISIILLWGGPGSGKRAQCFSILDTLLISPMKSYPCGVDSTMNML